LSIDFDQVDFDMVIQTDVYDQGRQQFDRWVYLHSLSLRPLSALQEVAATV
jgi:hypothetical protein